MRLGGLGLGEREREVELEVERQGQAQRLGEDIEAQYRDRRPGRGPGRLALREVWVWV